MTLQGLVVEASVLGREDDEGDHRDVTVAGLEVVIEPRQSLNEHVPALVTKLVSPSREEQQSFVKVKVEMTVKVSVDKVHDPEFVGLMQVLELVANSLDVEAIWRDYVRPPLDQVLRLLARDVTATRKCSNDR